jgi:hypothetical protein
MCASRRKFTSILAILWITSTAWAQAGSESSDQAIVIHFAYMSRDLKRLYDLEDKLEELLAKSKVGRCDGHEIAVDGSDGLLYLYGPDAEQLYSLIKPTLLASDFMQGAKVKLRFGPPKVGGPQRNVVLEK